MSGELELALGPTGATLNRTASASAKDGTLHLSLEGKGSEYASKQVLTLAAFLCPFVVFEQTGTCFWGYKRKVLKQTYETRNVLLLWLSLNKHLKKLITSSVPQASVPCILSCTDMETLLRWLPACPD